MAEKVRCTVVGPAEVDGVAAPGTVELDPDVYNIGALVEAGHVEVSPPTDPAPDDGAAGTARKKK